MAGRRRGARTGRGWDAAPPRTGAPQGERPRRSGSAGRDDAGDGAHDGGGFAGWADGTVPDRPTGPTAAVHRERPRDEGEMAREICLRLLAVRPRTRSELVAALIRRGISEEVAGQVLDRYDEVGMVDDAAFARAWVSSRHQGRGLARRALANELRQRGVAGEVTAAALEQLDEETEAQTARELVARKLRTARGEPDAVFRRLVAMLARKGYPAGVAVRAVKDALAARSAEEAELMEYVDVDALTGVDTVEEQGPAGWD
jgi:regulatory protein